MYVYNSDFPEKTIFSHAIKPVFTQALEEVSKYCYMGKLNKLLTFVGKNV
jgi:hypothetical protein